MVRKAKMSDLPQLLSVYARAREFMKKTGNPDQWRDNYPPRETVVDDIEKEQLYVVLDGDILLGVFMFFLGPEPTYERIEGAWGYDTPYGTIHRVASSGEGRGLFSRVLEFCIEKTPHIRIDTHADNLVMQHTLEKHGFNRCGKIYLQNGDPRIAYELMKDGR